MMLSKAVIAVLFCGLAASVSPAAEENSSDRDYVVKVWDADNGLTEASVTDVAQTPEGYLWIGTLFGSVLRFDGTRFVTFNSANTPEFSSKWGGSRLLVDRQGRLWISMYDGGLIMWNSEGFHSALASANHPERLLWSDQERVIFVDNAENLLCGELGNGRWDWKIEALPGVLPQALPFADGRGRVWFLRRDRTIGIWDVGRIESLPTPPAIQGQRIAALSADGQGNIWVGTDRTLAEWREDRFEIMTPTNGEAVVNVRIIVPAGDGFWVEANGRMRRCSGRQWVAESEAWSREVSKSAALRFVRGDAEGGLWSAVGDTGLIHVQSDGRFQRLTTRDGLPSNTILFAYQDRGNNTWTGYQRGGLVRIGRRLFQPISHGEGLNETLINTVCQGAGAVWIGTHDGAIVRCENGGCTNIFLPATGPLQDSIVTCDKNGTVWLAADGTGLFARQSGRIEQIATPAELGGYIRLMLPASDGSLWVGTLRTILSVSDEKLVRRYTAETAGDHPTELAQTADGTIWAGTLSGLLLRWNGREFIPVEPPERNSLGRIWALWPSPDGGLWVGTEQGGLLQWEAGKFRRYTTKNGLPSDSISQIIGDTEGNLWLGTRAGIVRLSRDSLARFENGDFGELPASIYGPLDGLLTAGSAIMFEPNCWRGQDGKLLFAMANSIAAVQPERVANDPRPPAVVLEGLRADETDVPLGRSGAIVLASESRSPDADPLAARHIGPGRGELEFYFSGLGAGSSPCTRFKYKLEDLENDWNEAGADRRAVYLHVPPGKYTFHVKACGNNGVWNEDSELIALIIEPHFYQTTWFRIALGLAMGTGLVLAVALTMRRRLHRRLEQMERQRALDRERTRIAQDLHDELGAGLTEIGLLSGLLQNPARFAERNTSALDRIAGRCRDLVVALDEIVWAVNPRNDSLDSLGNYLCLYAQGFLEPSSIRCWLEVRDMESSHSFNSEQRHNLFLAFKEALTNVVRHSGATEVHVRIFVEDSGRLVIAVEDNGRGLPPVVGRGADGLINLRQRMERIGGHCDITSSESGGVAVRLSLPLSATVKS